MDAENLTCVTDQAKPPTDREKVDAIAAQSVEKMARCRWNPRLALDDAVNQAARDVPGYRAEWVRRAVWESYEKALAADLQPTDAAARWWVETEPKLRAAERAGSAWWQATSATPPQRLGMAAAATAATAAALASATPPLRAVAIGDITSAALSPVEFAVEPIILRGHANLLGGHGGTGKTTLALVLLAHVACGQPWGGMSVAQGRGLFVSLEDSAELVRWRLRNVCEAYGLDAAAVARNHDPDARPESSTWREVGAAGRTVLEQTPAMHQVREAAAGATLIVIDNASDGFEAQENDRRQVRAFVRSLAKIARDNGAAVLLLAHIDKQAARFGSNEHISGQPPGNTRAQPTSLAIRRCSARTKSDLSRRPVLSASHSTRPAFPCRRGAGRLRCSSMPTMLPCLNVWVRRSVAASPSARVATAQGTHTRTPRRWPASPTPSGPPRSSGRLSHGCPARGRLFARTTSRRHATRGSGGPYRALRWFRSLVRKSTARDQRIPALILRRGVGN